jgi:hypothetical protein
MEVLPGIAQVLRSPVADAIVNLIRAACRAREFDLADADEMLNYAVRRNLMAAEERERVLAEARAFVQKRAERAAEREKPKKPVVVKSKPKPAAVKAAKPTHHGAQHVKPKPATKPTMVKSHPSRERRSDSPREGRLEWGHAGRSVRFLLFRAGFWLNRWRRTQGVEQGSVGQRDRSLVDAVRLISDHPEHLAPPDPLPALGYAAVFLVVWRSEPPRQ